MSKQRLLFITTGGTIASVRTAQGLKPVLTSEELLAHLPELQQLCCPETLNLCSIDSTDLGPEHWLMMAKAVQENYALYDGFIICHGTDTLAYSAAALSYLIQNADKPIILTGAQQPISNEITDAKKNLRDSVICALDPGSRGVMVVFGGHVIAGTRAKKNKTISYDAFASVNFPALALVQGDGHSNGNGLGDAVTARKGCDALQAVEDQHSEDGGGQHPAQILHHLGRLLVLGGKDQKGQKAGEHGRRRAHHNGQAHLERGHCAASFCFSVWPGTMPSARSMGLRKTSSSTRMQAMEGSRKLPEPKRTRQISGTASPMMPL